METATESHWWQGLVAAHGEFDAMLRDFGAAMEPLRTMLGEGTPASAELYTSRVN